MISNNLTDAVTDGTSSLNSVVNSIPYPTPIPVAGSLIMVSLVVLLQKLIYHLPPALVLVLSIALGAVSYSVFIWLTQKEEIREIRRLTGGWRGL